MTVQHLRLPYANRKLVYERTQSTTKEKLLSVLRDLEVGATTVRGNSKRKQSSTFSALPDGTTGVTNIVQYIGIASDEPLRIERHKDKKGIVMPLVDIGWAEADCRAWCEQNELLSPVYTEGTRDGCWFCHNQGVAQLRRLRHNHPDLWALLLKWDTDSPVTFHADGHTVHDFDKRFQREDEGWFGADDSRFKWAWVDSPPPKQLSIFDLGEQ